MDRALVEDEVLDEGRYDWLNFAFISQRIGANEGFGQGEPSLSTKALDVAVHLVGDGRLVAGDLTLEGFVPWDGEVSEVIDRLRTDADAIIGQYGYIPLAEVCWFATHEMLAKQAAVGEG